MVSGIFFNWCGVTHQLELSLFDGSGVWRGIVDGVHVVFFECGVDCDVTVLIDRAVDVWVGECLG